jgi:hypothetical protein
MMMMERLCRAHVVFWGRAPPRHGLVPAALLGHGDSVGRSGPLTAPPLSRRPREEKGRVREAHQEAVALVDDRPEERDRARQVVAYFN